MIIFLKAEINNIKSPLIYDLPEALIHIKKKIKENTHSSDYVERVNKEIKLIQDKYKISKQKHLENIKRYR